MRMFQQRCTGSTTWALLLLTIMVQSSTEGRVRAVAVDSRGIIESLRGVYDAGALAEEITGKK
jgi:hypothetical protein